MPTFTAALLFTLSALTRAAQAEGPPRGLGPTTVTLGDVIAAERRAAGPAAVAYVQTWRFEESGQTGTIRYVERGREYRATLSLGVFESGFGWRAGRAWQQNANGQTSFGEPDAIGDTTDRSTETTELASRGKLLGEVLHPCACYVVEFHRLSGGPNWAFFERASGRLARVERDAGDRRLVITLDDFRTSAGSTQAWHIHSSVGDSETDADAVLTSLEPRTNIPDADLDMPGDRRELAEFPPGVTRVAVPAQFIDDQIFIRLHLQGRDADFLLDSGASMILLDRGIAQGRGIFPPGTSAADMRLANRRHQVVIPELGAGVMRMHNVVAESLPFNYQVDPTMQVAGIVGFDFFDSAVVHIDYYHHQVELFDRKTFTGPPGEYAELSVALEDGVPMAPARIGDSVGTRFLIDTGSVALFVFPHFSKTHRDDLWDQGRGNIINRNYPYVRYGGVGGGIRSQAVEVAHFTFGIGRFNHFIVEKTEDDDPFGLGDIDGLIGYPLLRFYDLYFDYKNSRVILQPNDILRRGALPPPPPKS